MARILILIGVAVWVFNGALFLLMWFTREQPADVYCITCGRNLGPGTRGLPHSCGDAWDARTQRFHCSKEGGKQ